MWAIEVTLDGCPVPYEMCRCERPEGVVAILLALCRAQEMRPVTIRRVEPLLGVPAAAANPWPEEV